MKVALDIGHLYKRKTPNDKGARYKGYTEAELVKAYITQTYDLLQSISEVEVYMSDKEKGILVGDYWERRLWVNSIFSETDLYIQGHLNAGRGNYGLILFTSNKPRELLYGESLKESLSKTTDIRYKALKKLTSSDRGYNILKGFKCPAFILEPAFIDNEDHFLDLKSGILQRKIAQGIYLGIINLLQ